MANLVSKEIVCLFLPFSHIHIILTAKIVTFQTQGTRLQGGKDAGSARYIHTALTPIAPLLFNPADNPILKWCEDDGTTVEPKHYLPVLPMLLVNGACGIGTGFSVQVPCYNPHQLIQSVRCMLDGVTPSELEPWYRGFCGRILKIAEGRWMSVGTWIQIGPTRIRITELPIGVWTEDYKLFLEAHVEKTTDIKSFEPEYTDQVAAFTVVFASASALEKRLQPAIMEGYDSAVELELELKLTSTKGLSITNMYLFNETGRIQKYNTPMEVLTTYYRVRIVAYNRRRLALLESLQEELVYVGAKAQFVQDVIHGKIQLMDTPRCNVESQLALCGYPKKDGYEYLLSMPAHSFTSERRAQLEKKMDAVASELEAIKTVTPEQMWRQELDVLANQSQ